MLGLPRVKAACTPSTSSECTLTDENDDVKYE